MWKKPNKLLWQSTLDVYNGFVGAPHYPLVPHEASPVAPIIVDWYNTIRLYFVNNFDVNNQTRFFDKFKTWFQWYMVTEARALETNLQALPRLWLHATGLYTKIKEETGNTKAAAPGFVCKIIVECMYALAGDERHMLVGFYEDQPVFKKMPHVSGDFDDFLEDVPWASMGCMHHIQPQDVWMVPLWNQVDGEAILEDRKDRSYGEANQQLVEAAFYNQRYVVDHEGAYVRLYDCGNLRSLNLKVRSTKKNALAEILVRAETTKGAFFTVISEEQLLTATPEDFPTLDGHIAHVICKVYHDLVTAVEVPVGNSDNESNTEAIQPLFDDPSRAKWQVIPRRLKAGQPPRPIRHSAPEPSVREPVTVHGHKRRLRPGENMTDKQRQRVRAFEEEFGVVILDRLPEGHTFVLDHMSPKLTQEQFMELPRFMRWRMQQRLTKLLEEVMD